MSMEKHNIITLGTKGHLFLPDLFKGLPDINELQMLVKGQNKECTAIWRMVGFFLETSSIWVFCFLDRMQTPH